MQRDSCEQPTRIFHRYGENYSTAEDVDVTWDINVGMLVYAEMLLSLLLRNEQMACSFPYSTWVEYSRSQEKEKTEMITTQIQKLTKFC